LSRQCLTWEVNGVMIWEGFRVACCALKQGHGGAVPADACSSLAARSPGTCALHWPCLGSWSPSASGAGAAPHRSETRGCAPRQQGSWAGRERSLGSTSVGRKGGYEPFLSPYESKGIIPEGL